MKMALIKIVEKFRANRTIRAYGPGGRKEGRIIIPDGEPVYVYKDGVVRVLAYLYSYAGARLFYFSDLFDRPDTFDESILRINQSPILDAALYDAPKSVVNEPTFTSSKKVAKQKTAKSSKAAERLPVVGDVDQEVQIESKVKDIVEPKGKTPETPDISRTKKLGTDEFQEEATVVKTLDDPAKAKFDISLENIEAEIVDDKAPADLGVEDGPELEHEATKLGVAGDEDVKPEVKKPRVEAKKSTAKPVGRPKAKKSTAKPVGRPKAKKSVGGIQVNTSVKVPKTPKPKVAKAKASKSE